MAKRNEKWVEAEALRRGVSRTTIREELRADVSARAALLPVTCPMPFCGSKNHGAEAHR